MTQEVDARTIPGNGGIVRWLYDSATRSHVVTVSDAAGSETTRILTADGLDAYEAYNHPFARKTTADLFGKKEVSTC